MATDRPRLATPFSLYLDAVRFLAAVLVLLTHYVQFGLVGGSAAGFLPMAGHEAVIVFFVLSGFVIAYSTLSRQVSPRDYAAARLSRIYSVALPVVLLAFACAAVVAQLFGPGLSPDYVLHKAYIYLPLHLLFMGNMWQLSEVPPWLGPYWSLGYEAWYYVLFGALCFLRGRRRLLGAALVLAVMGYQMWLLFPVWAAGVWLYRRLGRRTVSLPAARIGWLASIVLLVVLHVLDVEGRLRALVVSLWPFAPSTLPGNDRFLGDYLVCALVVLNFACARDAAFTVLERWAAPIRKLSFFTFPLYLCHALVLGIWRSFHPQQDGGVSDILAVTAIIAAFTWTLGRGAEHLRLGALAWIARRSTRRTAAARPGFTDPLLAAEDDTLQSFPHKY
jgi:peptidoglycan/LPS O-acetylase OafA/YrhL